MPRATRHREGVQSHPATVQILVRLEHGLLAIGVGHDNRQGRRSVRVRDIQNFASRATATAARRSGSRYRDSRTPTSQILRIHTKENNNAHRKFRFRCCVRFLFGRGSARGLWKSGVRLCLV